MQSKGNGNGATVPVAFRNAGVPANTNQLRAGFGAVTTAPPSGAATFDGRSLLKLDKRDGVWVFGAEAIQVEEEAVIAIDPNSFKHGVIAWDDGKPAGEFMAPVWEPKPAAPVGTPFKFDDQLSFEAVISNGEDKGTELIFKTTSLGGLEGIRKLGKEILSRLDQEDIVPLVRLAVDSYRHKQYGKIYKPVFNVASWATPAGAVTEPVAPVEEAPATRRRRPAR